MKIKKPKLLTVQRSLFNAVKALLLYISLFVLFFFDSAFYPANNMSGTSKLFINIVAVIGLVVAFGMVMRIKKRLLLAYVIFCALIIVSGLSDSAFKKAFIMLVCVTTGFAVANFLSYSRFKKIYKDMMLFLAGFSLVTLVIWLTFPSFITSLPIIKSTTSNYHNAIFSVISSSTVSTRNFGLFWEPGAFAIFLNIALLFEMTDKKQSVLKIFIYMVAITTTMSTLGVICLTVLTVAYVFNKDRSLKNYKRNKAVIVLVSLAALIYIAHFGDDFVSDIFGKLSSNESGNISSSTKVRINAVIYPFMAFIKSPIVGVGFDEFTNISTNYCNSMATCTFINWLTIYGVFGIIFIVACVRVFLSHANTKISKLTLLLFALILFSTESFLLIGFVYIFVFYGILTVPSRKRRNR